MLIPSVEKRNYPQGWEQEYKTEQNDCNYYIIRISPVGLLQNTTE